MKYLKRQRFQLVKLILSASEKIRVILSFFEHTLEQLRGIITRSYQLSIAIS